MTKKTLDRATSNLDKAKKDKTFGLASIPVWASSKSARLPKNHPYLYQEATEVELDRFDWSGNRGIVTGKLSNLVVLDIDGDEGMQSLVELDLPLSEPTATVKTGDGYHVYFKYPDGMDIPTRLKKLAPGLDLKSDGGYVLAEGSIHPDGPVYQWHEKDGQELSIENVGIAEMPEELIEAIRKLSSEAPRRNVLDGPIVEGTRNNSLTAIAGTMQALGIPDSAIREALYTVNEKTCVPPLDEREVESILRSVLSYEKGKLRKAPTLPEEGKGVGISMDTVEQEEISWLWDGRIPLGKVTVLDGDPSLGKSSITMDIAARVSTGRPLPQEDEQLEHLEQVEQVGRGVVIISGEDGLADTIKPRLVAAEADCKRILAITTIPDGQGSERELSIPGDVETIEKAIQQVDASLVIIDPLTSFLKGDTNKDGEVRKGITPLARMAERTGAAVLVVRHLNKGNQSKAMYRGGGSIAIVGAARSGLIVHKHPRNPEILVLASTKSNLAEKPDSLTYSITTASNKAARIQWGKSIRLDADELIAEPDTSELGKAKEWLEDALSDGPVPVKDIEDMAKSDGYSWASVRRAKDQLKVQPKKDGAGGTFRWHLPNQLAQDAQLAQDMNQ